MSVTPPSTFMQSAQSAKTPGPLRDPESTSVSSYRQVAEWFTRFSTSQRIEHFVQMVGFTMLVATGLPQKFPATPWGDAMVWLFGGIDSTRIIHRFFATIFTLQALYHGGYIAFSLFVRRARPSMMPTLKDVSDVIVQMKYYLGRAKHEPRYDRFDYRQKFEYFGVVWGGVVMIVTGLIMAFPIYATRLLPGEFIPAAKEAHGGEALLAFLVIVIWHLYGTHLSPKRFPADLTIFTGKISRERMEEEHPVELERLLHEEQRKEIQKAVVAADSQEKTG